MIFKSGVLELEGEEKRRFVYYSGSRFYDVLLRKEFIRDLSDYVPRIEDLNEIPDKIAGELDTEQ